MVEELLQRGLAKAVAHELAMQYGPEHIRAKIDLLDWRLAQGGQRQPKNPAGFLAAAIRDDYQPPGSYRAASRSAGRSPAQTATPVAISNEAAQQQKRLEAARDYFQSLSPEEQVRIEKLAVEQGNRFQVATYQRLKDVGGKLWEETRDLLIATHLEQTQV